jgi:hypothetical protein
MLHVFAGLPAMRGQPNPVETAGNIAFAYGINHPPKSPFQGIDPDTPEGRNSQEGTP